MRNPLVEDFRAVAEDGSRCHVVVWQSWSDTSSKDKGAPAAPGLKSYRTADGRPLNRIDEQTFEIAETGQRFKRV